MLCPYCHNAKIVLRVHWKAMEPCCPGCGRVLEPQEFQELLEKKKDLLTKKREGFRKASK